MALLSGMVDKLSGIKEYSLEVLAIVIMIAGIAILVISITFLPKYQTVVIPMYRWTGDTTIS